MNSSSNSKVMAPIKAQKHTQAQQQLRGVFQQKLPAHQQWMKGQLV
jgi:hypothetical protein